MPSVLRVGWRNGCRMEQWRRGERAAMKVECSLNQNYIFARDNIHPSKVSLCGPLSMPHLLHTLTHISHPRKPFSSGRPGGAFLCHSNLSGIHGSFSEPTKLGVKAPSPSRIPWVGHWLWVFIDFGCDPEIQVVCP